MSLTPDSPVFVCLTVNRSGQYVASYSRNSNINVWNCSNGKKCIEIPIKTKIGTYSTINWSSRKLYIRKSKAIYLSIKSEGNDELGHEILAYGTTGGSVGLMYGLMDREIDMNSTGHSACVQDIVWNESCSHLYSASHDKTVVSWSISVNGFTPERVIKAWKNTVWKLAVSFDEKFLVAASSHIRIWDLHNETVMQKFSGHTKQVNCLEILHNVEGDISHIISVGEERMISIYRIQHEDLSEQISTLRCPYLPVSIHRSEKNNLFVVAANGIVYMYTTPFDLKPSKPIGPVWSLQVTDVSQNHSTGKPTLIPILSVYCLEEDGYLLLMYGNVVKPMFEKIAIDLSQKRVSLERNSIPKTSLNEKLFPIVQSTSNTEVPIQLVFSHQSKKVKRKLSVENDISFGQDTTLGELVAEQTGIHKSKDMLSGPIASGSLVQMLCQSLQSDDSILFDQVINVSWSKTIYKTVKSLPINYVLPLIDKLMSIMHSTPYCGPILMNWIKPCLTLHTAYLLTVPDLTERLGLLYSLLDARAANYEKLCQLQGKLDLLIHFEDEPKATEIYSPIAPKLVFEDDDNSSSDVDYSEYQELDSNSRDESIIDESAEELMK